MTDSKADWRTLYPTTSSQVEFFGIKFPDVKRDLLHKLRSQFDQFDSKKRGELEDDEAMRLLEHRGETKTVKELRQMFSKLDLDGNHKLSFLELCCAMFNKSWETLHAASGDPDQVDSLKKLASQANDHLARQAEELKKATEASNEAKQKHEHAHAHHQKAAEEKAKLEADLAEKKRIEDEKHKKDEESKKAQLNQGGAKGKAAMFQFAAAATVDTTKDNAERIKKERAEAKARQELDKKAADAKKEAEDAERKSREAAEMEAMKQKEAEEAERDRKQLEEQEAAALAAKKLRDEYLAAKAKEDEEKRHKEEEEKKKKEESKARLAAKSALWK